MASSSEASPITRSEKSEKSGVRKLGKYEFQKQLGAGGMGTVYLARDTQLRRPVALKILSKERAANPTLVRRFQAEAQAAAQLRHENIVAVYENGEIDGYLFIAMEYVEGIDVEALIRKRGKLPPQRALEIVKQVASALQHAYEHQIVHRDIKPSNLILRNDGVVKLTDLGLARSIDETLETNITRAGTTVGTIDYMSPEQARNSKLADIRSDIYSLGCTWYHMLVGKPPFFDGSMTNKLHAHAVKPPPDPRNENKAVTEATVAILNRMLAKKPEDRYQTPAELLQDLKSRVLTQGGVNDEVFSAITEADEPREMPKYEKRGLPGGVLPPKQKTEGPEEDSQEHALTWEAIKPFMIGGLILCLVIGLGLLVAGWSGGLDFSIGPVAKRNDRPSDSTAESAGTPPQPVIANTTQQSPNQKAQNASQPQKPLPKTIDSPSGPLPQESLGAGPAEQLPPIVDSENIPDWSVSTEHEETFRMARAITHHPVTNPELLATLSTVGTQKSSNRHFATLAEALRSLPPSGGTIVLTDSKPYELSAVALSNQSRVVLLGAEGKQPTVILRPDLEAVHVGLELTGGELIVEGLHFAVDRSQFPGSDPVKFLSVIDGKLTVRHSTFTIWGEGAAPVWALHSGSQLEPDGRLSTLPSQVLIDETFIRGDRVTALAVSRPSADVVVRGSLFVSGAEPVIRVSGKLPDQLAEKQDGKPRRAIRFLQSTLYGREVVFQVSSNGAANPPVTAIEFTDSVCASSNRENRATLLQASDWPHPSQTSSIGKLYGLSWLMKNSVVLGFERLADLGENTSQQYRNVSEWQTLWTETFSANQFASNVWPTDIPDDLIKTLPIVFNRPTLPVREVLRADNSPPGCETSYLLDASNVSPLRLSALIDKPEFPVGTPEETEPPQTVSIDASKADLGRELQNGTWPPGTVIEVTGSGPHTMTPVILTKKFWKIVGVPVDETPLSFSPRSVASDADGLIVVEEGVVEISNLRFQISGLKQKSLTSLIVGRNSRLTLNNINLQGSLTDFGALDSLVQYSAETSFNGSFSPALICQNSSFIGSGRCMRLELGARPIFLKNCLVACRGDALDIRIPVLPEGVSPGPLLANHVTFSATLGAIHLRNDSVSSSQIPHRFYFDECAFVPSLSTKASDREAPTLFSVLDPETDFRTVEWWGDSNGVSPEVPSLIRADIDLKPNPSQTGLTLWNSIWNPEQTQRLLMGSGGIVMEESLEGKSGTISPANFALHPSCRAAQWDHEHQPIGADVRNLETKSTVLKPKEKEAGKKPPGKGPVKRPTNRLPGVPDF